MLNMERMVGTITPKKVLSFRGSLLGELDSGVASCSAPHSAVAMVRLHPRPVIRGVRSVDMAAERRRRASLESNPSDLVGALASIHSECKC